MKKDFVPAGRGVSSGTFECPACKTRIKIQSVISIPPCAQCHNGGWKVISGVADAKDNPYPND